MPRSNGAHALRSLTAPPPKSCEQCEQPIPFRPHHSIGVYLAKRFCSARCSQRFMRGRPRGSSTARWQRALEQLAERERHPAPVQTVAPPYGHECEVCHEVVRKGHPIHYAERPERAEAAVIGPR